MNFLRKRKDSSDDNGFSNEIDDDYVNEINDSTIHKSRKPPNTAFRQQRLKAWQPILTPKSVIPLLILLTVIFTPLGIAIIFTTYNVEELNIDYSNCEKLANYDTYGSIPDKYTGYHFKHIATSPDFKWKLLNETSVYNKDDEVTTCLIQFNLPKDLKPPLYLYYKLTNFFQNHRKYVESYDLDQLGGKALSSDDVTDNCKPLKHREYKGETRLIYPCGLIANSYFNDSINSPILLNTRSTENNETYEFVDKDISWPSDRNHKFKKTSYKPDDVVPPPNWDRMYPDGYTNENLPNVQSWEHLQNWMRTAALPNFYKLYGQNKSSVMSSGTYQMSVQLHYPVEIFGGSKNIIITTNSIFGGRNIALGIIYIIVAVISLVLGIAFLIQYLIKPRKIGDHNFLQNSHINRDIGVNNDSYRDQL
ncbi:unnamed protein product [Candida verbasci]|uniref:Cell division control protein 50 n=1 Tax=Candida verbasci TaxID=1227364 RepID=A0A9W4U325_9ASCO|nr:unnamed protein product [Candida verbasci]